MVGEGVVRRHLLTFEGVDRRTVRSDQDHTLLCQHPGKFGLNVRKAGVEAFIGATTLARSKKDSRWEIVAHRDRVRSNRCDVACIDKKCLTDEDGQAELVDRRAIRLKMKGRVRMRSSVQAQSHSPHVCSVTL